MSPVPVPHPTSISISSIQKNTVTDFYVDGTNLENVNYVKGVPGPSSVTITSATSTWDVLEGKSQGTDGKKVKVTASATWGPVPPPGPGGSTALGTPSGSITITITNSGGNSAPLSTTINYV